MDEDNSGNVGGNENAGNMGKNDPYRNMDDAQKSITPGFLGGKGGGGAPAGLKEKNNDAKNTLNDAERGALGDLPGGKKSADSDKTDKDDIGKIRKDEEGAKGFYSGNKAEKGKGKKRGRFSLKKSGPMFGIFGLIIGIGGFMGGMQSMMPVAIEEMIIEKLNSYGIASTVTSDGWFDDQLNNSMELHHVPSDCNADLLGFSDYQVDQFKQHGIYTMKPEVVTDEGIVKITALLFLKNDNFIPVIGSDYYNNERFNNDALVESLKQKAGVDNIGKPISAPDALNDKTFKKLYIAASKTWRGGSSGWFDQIMKNITEIKLNITRNRWTRYSTMGVRAIAKKEFKKLASLEGNEKTKGKGIIDEGQEDFEVTDTTDDDGNVKKTGQQVDTGEDNPKLEASDADSREKLKGILNSKGIKAAKMAANVSNIACNVASAAMAIYGIVAGYQALQFLNLTTGFLEAVDRVKAGEVDSSPMNEYANELTTGHATMVSDRDGNDSIAPGKENTSGMASMGMSWLFDNDDVSGDDASVQNVNFESIMNRIVGISNAGVAATKLLEVCGYVKLAGSIFDVITDVMAICTLGVGSIVKTFVQVAISMSFALAAAPLISIMINYTIKSVADLLIKDAATEWMGEDLGNALVSGAGKYLGGNALSHGLGLGDAEKTAAFRREQNAVIAEEAEYQRSIRSPFDMTSKYTFLGSMAYAMIPIAYSGSGVMSMLRQASSMTTNAITKLLPTADAVSMSNNGLVEDGCQLLNGIGAVGDIYCNPYVVMDTSLSHLSYSDIVAVLHGDRSNSEYLAAVDLPEATELGLEDNFEDCKIKDDSTLAKYITYCGERTSQFGVYDASIMEQTATPGQKVNSLIASSGVPIVSSIATAVANGIEVNNASWINGSACIASDRLDKNPRWRTELNAAQQYVIRESVRSEMDRSYKSPVLTYIEEQREKNPVDQSLEGTIARFSGMTKEDVELGLDLIEYYQFLEDYDPSTRYAFGAPAVEESAPNYDNENVLAGDVIMPERILYADIRNRTFVV